MRKIGMTRLLRTGNFVFAFLLVSIFASQCFAQSPAQSSKNSARESRQYMEMMNGIFDFVQKNYVDEVDPAVLYRGALKGMLESLEDPYTLYLDTSTMRSLSDTTEGKFVIGHALITDLSAFQSGVNGMRFVPGKISRYGYDFFRSDFKRSAFSGPSRMSPRPTSPRMWKSLPRLRTRRDFARVLWRAT